MQLGCTWTVMPCATSWQTLMGSRFSPLPISTQQVMQIAHAGQKRLMKVIHHFMSASASSGDGRKLGAPGNTLVAWCLAEGPLGITAEEFFSCRTIIRDVPCCLSMVHR